MADEVKRIGVMVGREWSWPPAFIEEVNRRNAGVVAEFLKIGGTRMNEANAAAFGPAAINPVIGVGAPS